MPVKKKRIKSAIKKPGSFKKRCKSKGYGGVTKSCIAVGKRSSSSTTRKRATLANTLRRSNRKR